MKPLDIDGNELRVGDDVEFVKDASRREGITIKVGDRFVISEITGPKFVPIMGCDQYYANFDAIAIVTPLLRLIPRDKKADKQLAFEVRELMK